MGRRARIHQGISFKRIHCLYFKCKICMITQHVKIGPKFFENELRVYRDWGLAFWRENLQNSVDAFASRIDIQITAINDQQVRCVIADNGCGMTKEQLESIYFVLGETTKSGIASIGGFGKARILTCFSQHSYKLETGNLLVTGCGADFSITETTEKYTGVRLTVDVNARGVNLQEKLESYLGKCFLHCHVYVNGIRWEKWTYKNRIARELSFGTIYTNKSQYPEVLVRVNGTLMFCTSTSAPSQIILEITDSRSRQVLQSSRDGLIYPFQGELDSFISELNINKLSALKTLKNKSTVFKGIGTFSSKRKQIARTSTALNEINNTPSTAEALQVGTFQKPTVKSNYSSEYLEYEGLNLFDIIIEDDSSNMQVRKVIDHYNPYNWDLGDNVTYAPAGSYRKGIGRLKLMLCWKAACERVIEILQTVSKSVPDEIRWGVGWYFSDDYNAACKTVGNVNYLILNPCDEFGKMKYNISNHDHMCKLIGLAIHEISHIMHSDHDECFAGLMTEITNAVLASKQEILNYMKEVKNNATLALSNALV